LSNSLYFIKDNHRSKQIHLNSANCSQIIVIWNGPHYNQRQAEKNPRLWLKADASRRQSGPRKLCFWRSEHSAARRKPVRPAKGERSKSGITAAGLPGGECGGKDQVRRILCRSFLFFVEEFPIPLTNY